MAGAHCTCGFTEADGRDETIGDHLLDVFAPEDDKGADGRVHLEGEVRLACLCGFSATTTGELDSHFLDVFMPVNSRGRDGVEHRGIQR
jgi:hypothetical protein